MAGFLNTKRKGIQAPEELQLNSLVDIFSTLIFFLLQLFAAGSESVVDSSIRLPVSITEAEIKADTVIGITPDKVGPNGAIVQDGVILIEGFAVAKLQEERNRTDQLVIPGLQDILQKVRKRAQTWQAAGGLEDWEGRVIIQGDRKIDFEIIKRVMATAGAEGFSIISLAVSKGT